MSTNWMTRRMPKTKHRPQPLSREDVLALVEFINGNDPRFTAIRLTTMHADYPFRAQCFQRETGTYAQIFHSVEDYSTNATAQVEDPQFHAALGQWTAARS